MPTKIDDADLEVPEFDWSRAQPNRYALAPREKTDGHGRTAAGLIHVFLTRP
jgi:hypothetical protein